MEWHIIFKYLTQVLNVVFGNVKADEVVSVTSPPDGVVPGDVNSGFGV